jgi:hypothetical protein
MAAPDAFETFTISKEFHPINAFFLYKYARENPVFSILELVDDLKRKLDCTAAALLQYDDGKKDGKKDVRVDILYPSQAVQHPTLRWVIAQPGTKKEIRDLIRDDQASGRTIKLEMPVAPGEKGGPMYVELIPMPRLADTRKDSPFDQLFILVEAAKITPFTTDRTSHESERTLISLVLCDWWVRALAPTFRRPQDVISEKAAENEEEKKKLSREIEDEEKKRFQELWKTRRYIVAPSVLIEEGLQAKEDIRRAGRGKVFNFLGEREKDGEFKWADWTPLKPGRESLETARNDAELLVYWCRWIDSHHDLEREQTASIRTPSFHKKADTPVTKWVENQRKDPLTIEARLKNLRLTAARAFLSGGAENIPITPEIMAEELRIGYKSLLCFSLHHWLAEKGWLRTSLTINAFGDVEFCRALHSLAITAHYLLGGQRNLEVDVIHRLMRQVAQYGHEDLGIPDRIDLRAHLLQAARGEPALHALKHFYRDHFFHTLEVCFLGHVLLETKLEDNRYLWQVVAKRLSLPDEEIPVLRLWYIAALLHDVGHGMEVLNSSREYFKFFKHSEALKSLQDSFEEAARKLSDAKELDKVGISEERRKVKDLGTEKNHGIGEDHGVIGALHLQTLLEHIHVEEPNVDPEKYKPAVQAIALHNLRRREDKISFSRQPLAFLLAVCDQLQEWRRLRLAYATSPQWMLSRLRGASGETNIAEGSVSSMKTDLHVESGATGDIHLMFQPNGEGDSSLAFMLNYDNGINRNSGIFSTWLDATLNFQRLDFTGLPLDISVTYSTPLYNNDGHNPAQPQLHRLRNAAFETHMSFLMDWFPDKPGKINGKDCMTNGAVSYLINGDREELTLHLRNLAGKGLMTKNLRAFQDCLKEWKLYNEDRDFPGDYAPVIPD